MLFAADGEPAGQQAQQTTTPTTPTSTAPAPPAQPEKPMPSAAPPGERPSPATARAARRPVARAADASATIRDFSFNPRSITINQGETVTWRNNGPSVHTATARNGSFDTGNLARGQSGSHTFNGAGTFSYFCRPHPNMTATITVRATGGGGGGSGSSAQDAGSGGTGAEDSGSDGDPTKAGGGSNGSDRDLANTGIHVAWVAWFGALLLTLGAALRFHVRRGR
jgi:plastocyanin